MAQLDPFTQTGPGTRQPRAVSLPAACDEEISPQSLIPFSVAGAFLTTLYCSPVGERTEQDYPAKKKTVSPSSLEPAFTRVQPSARCARLGHMGNDRQVHSQHATAKRLALEEPRRKTTKPFCKYCTCPDLRRHQEL